MLLLVVTCRAGDAELAAQRLWDGGVLAVEEGPVEPGSDLVELRTSLGDDDATRALGRVVGRHWPVTFRDVDPGVADTWRDHAQPVRIDDDLVVVPAWTDPAGWPAARHRLVIEPGATFGMGDHPTTIATLRAMRHWITPDTRVLDVGSGSGILAVAACVLGARAALGIDISDAAVPVGTANAGRNGVAERARFTTEPLEAVAGPFDLVLANILAPTLVALAPHLQRVLAPAGALVFSGVLAERHEHVLAALRPLRPVERIDLDGWSAVTVCR
jgi:ribosomal protein L11 methyltransferase